MDVANPCLIWYLVKFNRVWAPFLSSKKVWLQYSQYFELLKVLINKVLHFSSADNWEHFRRADLLQEALQNMRMGNLSVGLTIWVQHQVRAGYRIFRNLKMRTPVSYRWNSIAGTPIDQSSWSLEVKLRCHFFYSIKLSKFTPYLSNFRSFKILFLSNLTLGPLSYISMFFTLHLLESGGLYTPVIHVIIRPAYLDTAKRGGLA